MLMYTNSFIVIFMCKQVKKKKYSIVVNMILWCSYNELSLHIQTTELNAKCM